MPQASVSPGQAGEVRKRKRSMLEQNERRGMNEIARVCARARDRDREEREGVREGEATRVGSVSSSQVIGDLPSTTRYLGPSTSLREQVGRCWARRRHLDHLGIAGELRPRYRDTRRSQEAS